jgi:hypothetical protein
MAKNTTKKIKELKGIKPDKITEEQLIKLQDVVSNLNRMQMEVGILETRKHRVLHKIAGFNDALTVMQGEFEKEYGTYDIDIANGTINYPKENGEVNKED